jgi:hypothetical protein
VLAFMRLGGAHADHVGLKRLRQVFRGPLTLLVDWDSLSYQYPEEEEARKYGTALQIPCLSSIRWSASFDRLGLIPPWRATANTQPHDRSPQRTVLMSFIGSGNTGFKAWLYKWCAKQPAQVCTAMISHGHNVGEGPQLELSEIMALKRSSLFCLEPEGLNPGRKSQVDGILSGCVPIFLMPKDIFEDFWPLHFGWRHQAALQVDPAQTYSQDLTSSVCSTTSMHRAKCTTSSSLSRITRTASYTA